MRKVILATHAAFSQEGLDVYGPAHAVSLYFLANRIPHMFIKYPIYGGFSAVVVEHPQGRHEQIGGASLPVFIRPFWELWMTIRFCFIYRGQIPVCIGVDPLNAFAFIIARGFGWVNAVIFYTPDFTANRFRNPVVNTLYHLMDQWTARHADQVWCVSQTIMTRRKEQQIPEDKVYYLPNTPSLRKVGDSDVRNKNKYHLVMVGNIVQTLDYRFVIRSVNILKTRFPKLKLTIVGAGRYMAQLKAEVTAQSLGHLVSFKGQLPNDKVIQLLKTCGVGIALYDGKCSTNVSGDSMKIREYMACGLPVITTDVTETARLIEEYHAGEIVPIERRAFEKALEKILDKNRYRRYSENALRAARAFDFDRMIAVPLATFHIHGFR